MPTLKQKILDRGRPPILSHKFGDHDITEIFIDHGTVDLYFDPDNLGDEFIQIHRDDAIALAKHYGVTAEELQD